MPRQAKEVHYERHDPLAMAIARHYLSNDPDLSHITMGEVRFVRVTGKKSNNIVEVKGIEQPISLFTDFRYIVVIYADAFDDLSEVKQNLFILHALTSIGEEFDGKKRKEEVKEFEKFVANFGAYWYLQSDEYLEERMGRKFKPLTGKRNTADVTREEEELDAFINS